MRRKAPSSESGLRTGETAARAGSRRANTLDRLLSRAGICSRSQAAVWLAAGRVQVNGSTARDPALWIQPGKDFVSIDGEPLRPAGRVYLILHKPAGYLTTRGDPGGRPTVYDLLTGLDIWVAPVGRLDLETSGMLLLTNDTAWADRIAGSGSGVAKTYLVETEDTLHDSRLARLRAGIELRDGPAQPATVRRVPEISRRALEIRISEGRNRQVRRMVEAAGSRARRLHRSAIGDLNLTGLAEGQWRFLTAPEVRQF